jgi:T4 bacteriophage base plate protein
MALPKIELPAYDFVIPSSGKEIRVRPFTVKEEKLLLMAIESKIASDIITTVKQVINNCILDGEIDVDKLPFFDIDYLFIFLRAKSVGETVAVKLTCNNVLENGNVCGADFMADMDISNVELIRFDGVQDDIKLGPAAGVRMRYPNYNIMRKIEELPDIDKKTHIIVSSIDYIYDKSGMHSYKDYTTQELKDFVEGLTEENYKKLEAYVDRFPAVAAKIEAKCPKCGFDHKVRYTDFFDFFI